MKRTFLSRAGRVALGNAAHGRPRLLLFAMIATVIVSTLLVADVAKALSQTPWTQDETPKYYQATVEYDDFGSYVNVQSRWWRGARDGGALRWQRYWLNDWSWNGSSWVWQRGWGESGWDNNVQFGNWSREVGFSITQPAAINYKLRYYECDAMGLNCYHWCSPQLDHYLWNNTSAKVGQGC